MIRSVCHRQFAAILKILVDKLLEAGEDVGVDNLTGYKLTLVEPQAIVEEQLDVGGYQPAGHAVDVMV